MDFLKRVSIYYLVIFFLLFLYFLGSFQFGAVKAIMQLLPSVLGAVGAGIILDYFELKRFNKPLTPLITGLIIGLTGQFGEDFLTLFAIGVISMVVKFIVKFDGRHILNPGGAGLLMGFLIFNSAPSWWSGGLQFWPFLIWIPVFIYRFRRWAPMAGFVSLIVLFNGFKVLLSSSLLFFISVMLIEPKTSPAGIKNGFLYGIIIGIAYLFISQTSFDPLVTSLLIGNLGARLLDKYLI